MSCTKSNHRADARETYTVKTISVIPQTPVVSGLHTKASIEVVPSLLRPHPFYPLASSQSKFFSSRSIEREGNGVCTARAKSIYRCGPSHEGVSLYMGIHVCDRGRVQRDYSRLTQVRPQHCSLRTTRTPHRIVPPSLVELLRDALQFRTVLLRAHVSFEAALAFSDDLLDLFIEFSDVPDVSVLDSYEGGEI